MLDAILSILPYALAAACAAPIVAVVTAVILSKSSRPVPGGIVFTAGAGSLDAVVATVILVAFWGTDASTSGSDIGAYIDTGLGVLFLTIGVLAIFAKDTPEKDVGRKRRVDHAAERLLLGQLASLALMPKPELRCLERLRRRPERTPGPGTCSDPGGGRRCCGDRCHAHP